MQRSRRSEVHGGAVLAAGVVWLGSLLCIRLRNLETGVIRSPRKIVVTMGILLENRAQRIEGVSGRALGPGLAFLDAHGAGHTGFAGRREPR